ncbi:MAG TPA: type II toxin-antitoxin system RelE/ParE family toxin [Pseudonocardiaceae bacterium]|nr:type II toxin-antitoxin system RelE/ParE family toxin [Pseudonocardiaceae bacterium]
MNVTFHPDVYKQLQQLPRQVFSVALNAIIALTNNPRPAGVKKLVGSRSDWRIRIGEYRIIYEIDDTAKSVTVVQVAHRRDAYR